MCVIHRSFNSIFSNRIFKHTKSPNTLINKKYKLKVQHVAMS